MVYIKTNMKAKGINLNKPHKMPDWSQTNKEEKFL